MARIEGVNLPSNKRVEYALPYIFGIGLVRAQHILREVKINFDKRVKDLTDTEIATIQKFITETYKVEGELRKEITLNIKRLQEIKSWAGMRHSRNLPLKGRTKTNARTRKGPRKNPVALKRKVTKK